MFEPIWFKPDFSVTVLSANECDNGPWGSRYSKCEVSLRIKQVAEVFQAKKSATEVARKG
ncbi:hypothetical protein BSPA111_26910 [Buttiauxella sp. A111]|nr:hypothetical protein BSPA111_26910 [Buttiauxella sp. A111]